MKKKFFCTGGFSMMEVLIALILLAAVSPVAMSIFSSSAKVMTTDKVNVAYNIARSMLEDVLEEVRADWWSVAGHHVSLINGSPTRSLTLDNTPYSGTWVVNGGSGTPVDQNADGIEDYRRMTVTVSW